MKKHGFTLVEILVSIVIIAILAGMLIAGIGYGMKRADEGATTATILNLQNALENFHQQNGYYPPSSSAQPISVRMDGGNMMVSINGVEYRFYDKQTKRSFIENFQAGDTYETVNDAWEHPLMYRCPGTHNREAFDLWSIGPEKTGTDTDDADNICNWESAQ